MFVSSISAYSSVVNHYPWVIISTNLTWWWAQKGVPEFSTTQPQKVFSAGKQCPCWCVALGLGLPFAPQLDLQGSPSWNSVCAPKWVSVGLRQANLTARKGHPQRRLQGCEYKTKAKIRYNTLHYPAVKLACWRVFNKEHAQQSRKAEPSPRVKPCISLHTCARGAHHTRTWEPLDTVHSLPEAS